MHERYDRWPALPRLLPLCLTNICGSPKGIRCRLREVGPRRQRNPHARPLFCFSSHRSVDPAFLDQFPRHTQMSPTDGICELLGLIRRPPNCFSLFIRSHLDYNLHRSMMKIFRLCPGLYLLRAILLNYSSVNDIVAAAANSLSNNNYSLALRTLTLHAHLKTTKIIWVDNY